MHMLMRFCLVLKRKQLVYSMISLCVKPFALNTRFRGKKAAQVKETMDMLKAAYSKRCLGLL